jgi:hypothetical protein
MLFGTTLENAALLWELLRSSSCPSSVGGVGSRQACPRPLLTTESCPLAALPPDLPKGYAFPGASTLTSPLGSAGRLSLAAEPRGRRKQVCGGKPEAFPSADEQSRFVAGSDATLRHFATQ